MYVIASAGMSRIFLRPLQSPNSRNAEGLMTLRALLTATIVPSDSRQHGSVHKPLMDRKEPIATRTLMSKGQIRIPKELRDQPRVSLQSRRWIGARHQGEVGQLGLFSLSYLERIRAEIDFSLRHGALRPACGDGPVFRYRVLAKPGAFGHLRGGLADGGRR